MSSILNQIGDLSSDQKKELLARLQKAKHGPSLTKATFPELFYSVSERYPDRIAVSSHESQLTYSELAKLAKGLAGLLQARGVTRGSLVGLCVPRSIGTAVSLLGVMTAGAAYIPLDPTLPHDRIRFMVENAGAEVVVASSSVVEMLPNSVKEIIVLEDIWEDVVHNVWSLVTPELSSDDLAYVMYTSGSTGQPKGVTVTHRGIPRLAQYMFENFGHSTPRRVLQHTSMNFDISVIEYISALLCGSTLVLAAPDIKAIGEELAEVLIEQAIEVLTITPTALATLPEESLPFLRYLAVGGEASSIDLVKTWSPGRHFFNGYGPTEITIVACMAKYDTDLEMLHIGQSIAGARLFVLDSRLQIVPPGVPGELYIGGPGLARGYIGQPALTAEAFIANPFADDGSRLYRTGDKVRQLPNGDIEFMGRIDQQVKLRGFRVELGEIEQALQEHPLVRQAAVVISEEGPTKRLVAFVMTREPVAENILREYVAESLPSYMVPSLIVVVETLPLGPTGKVDRKKLLSMVPDGTKEEYVAARTETEEQLTIVWQEVLGLEKPPGIFDNFFALGGDSILSLQVVFRARQAGIHLTVKQLFEHPTIADLAVVADIMETEVVHAEQGLVTGAVELTPIQKWFFHQKLNNANYFNQSVVVDVPTGLGEQDWERIIGYLLAHHDAFRTQFTYENKEWLAEIGGMPERIPLMTMNLTGMTDDECREVMTEVSAKTQAGLRLDSPPLLQAVLFTGLSNGEDRLLLVAHHLVVDVVSWQIVLEDLETLVAATQRGEELSLPDKTTSWQHWASRLSAEAESDQTLSELDFWKMQDQASTKELPLDGHARNNIMANMETHDSVLNPEDTRALLQEIPEVFGTHINDVLLTAVGAALGSWSDSDYIRLDLEGHGREMVFGDVDVSRTVGWFTTISPVLVPVVNEKSLVTGLKQVKELMKSRPRNGIGYGLLSEKIAGGKSSGAQVSFNYLGQLDNMGSQYALGMNMAGSDSDLNNERPYLIDIIGRVSSGQLCLSWNYCREAHNKTTIAQLAEHTMSILREMVAVASDPEVHGYTPSDFPVSGMKQEQINQMMDQLRPLPIWGETGTLRPLVDCYPQTPVQQGLWFQSRMAEEEGVYHVQSVFKINQEVDINALRKAWSQVMWRHTALRTSFWEDKNGQAYQLVWNLSKPPMEVQDWSSDLDKTGRLDNYLVQDRERGFSPSDVPQWRVLLAKTGSSSYQIIWSAHHAIIDGWSIGLLLNDLTTAYDAILEDTHPVTTTLPRPYRDYVSWLTTQSIEDTEAFWRTYLQGFNESTPLPNVMKGALIEKEETLDSVAYVAQVMDAGMYTKLQKFSKENSLTLNTVLQGAWALVLGRYAGLEDVVFGTVASGRTSEVKDIERMVGLFINTLPLRVKLPNEKSVVDWLRDLQETSLQVRQHEHTPLNLVNGWTEVPSGAPLFETLFVFENYPIEETEANLNLRQIETREKTHYPLSLVVTASESLNFDLMYDTQYVDDVTAERIHSSLETVCSQLMSDSKIPLGKVTTLSEEELIQVVEIWSTESLMETTAPFLHELVEESALKIPDSVAIVYDDEQITYKELNRRANQLGSWLQSRGVGPDELVGLYVDRSIESFIGLLGILKAGGGYVPMDITLPTERMAWIVEDARLQIVLTQQHIKNNLPSDLEILCLDTEWDKVSNQLEITPKTTITGDNLAYIIYTSGSTGKPKGVMVAHRCFGHVIPWIHSQPKLNRPRRVLQVASLGFDFSVWEMILPFATGGVLHVPSRGSLMIGNELGSKIQESSIESLNFTPGALITLEDSNFPHLDSLLIGGEAYSADLIRKWAPGRSYQNVYGPTETTIFATAAPLDETVENIHMGRPITNVEIYVLDSSMRHVPPGCEGELYIGGAGLTRGYLNQPDLTAERYVADPFGKKPGSRLYRSGDIVRFRSDGNVEFVGRADDQIKIRGFRIELGEIEAKLKEHPAVANSAVVVHEEDGDGSKQLVAYIALHSGEKANNESIEQFLHAQLPYYMVPKNYIFMESMPLNRNGKINRSELPVSEIGFRKSEVTPPRTPTERSMVSIWEDVLNQSAIGIEDDFFSLGGHSLLAVRIVARIQRDLGIECPLHLIFDYPILQNLATEIDKLKKQNEKANTIVRVSREMPLPATTDQQRLWFMEQLHPDNSLYTVGWLQYWQTSLDSNALCKAIDRLSLRHEPLRTTFKHDGESVFQVISPEPIYEFTEIDISSLSDKLLVSEIESMVHDFWKKPFNLEKGPLLRINMVSLPNEETLLVISAHHNIIDGFSISIFNNELKSMYKGVLDGSSEPVPLEIQFADYAYWQEEKLRNENIDSHLKFFIEQLKGAPSLISLPTDRPRPAVQDFKGANTHVTIDSHLIKVIEQATMSTHTTKFVVFLSAIAVVLSRYSGQDQVVLGITMANRNRYETEPMVGFLVNTLALCIDLTGNPNFEAIMGQVQNKLLEAHKYQDIPFERVVDHLKPERSLSHSPVFQVLVTELDKFFDEGDDQETPEWVNNIMDKGVGISRFDLSLSLQTRQDELQLAFEYATSLFDEETIKSLGNHILTFLRSAIENPKLPIKSVKLLNGDEYRRIIDSRNQTDDSTTLSNECLHELFERQAKRIPDRIAVSFQDKQITYAQMDSMVEDIAIKLKKLGAGPDVHVGICMFRSIDLVIGLHAIHRSGAAYVPLDPELPAERLGYVIDNANIDLVLAQEDTISYLSENNRPCVLIINDGEITSIDGEAKLESQISIESSHKTSPDNLAYVLYTSGSTGKPKGVMLNHRGVVNRLLWMQKSYPLLEDDRVLQKTPFGFDVSVWEFFWPLLVGARLHVAEPEGHRDPDYLTSLIQEQCIGTIHFVPSMLQHFIQHTEVEQRVKSLRHIICSGEALPINLLEEIIEKFPNTNLHNLYGPTEASVDVSYWDCKTEPNALSVPIGYPVTNTQLYILDSTMSPVPDGVVGELYIGGVQLARGYLAQPDLTAETFIADPFRKGRMYATGDLARFRPDGAIEYIGRTDHQVKIRGLRIEIGEIETILAEYPTVGKCVVVVHEFSSTDKRLTAFLTVEGENEIDFDDIREFLLKRLPEYMVPTYYMVLPEIPLNANGKINRKALPSKSEVQSFSRSSHEYVEPRTEMELRLVQLWQEIFEMEQIGIRDDFFVLGGHSLLVARMAAELQKRWDINLKLTMVFQNHTIEALAKAIEEDSINEDELDADELWDLV